MKTAAAIFLLIVATSIRSLMADDSLVGQRIYPKTNAIPIQSGNSVIATSSDLVYPVRIREVQGDWLQIWVGSRVVSSGWILRQNVCTTEEAITYFSNAIAVNPNDQHSLYMRSLAYVDVGRHEEAIQDATQLVLRWPSAAHHTALANRLESAGRTDEALFQYAQALARRPNHFWSRHARGELWIKLEQWANALDDANLCVAYHPNHASGYTLRARIWKHLNQPANAAADYENARRINPENSDIVRSLAWLRATCPDATVRNSQEALILAQSACTLTKFNPSDCFETLAAAHADNGQYAEALTALQKANELMPHRHEDRRKQMQSLFESNQPFRDVPIPKVIAPPVAAPVPDPVPTDS